MAGLVASEARYASEERVHGLHNVIWRTVMVSEEA